MSHATALTPAPPIGTTGQPLRRWLVLAICCLSVGVTGINLSIVNVALPSIGRELHAEVTSLQWVASTYSLVMACLLMLSGSMADRVGRKRIFQTGLVLFAAGSLLCGLAPSVGWLIGFVAIQAVGGSMLNPVAMSIIAGVFTDRAERAKAIGVWGSVIGITIAVGPVLGGLLVDGIGWRSVFWISVPIAALALILTGVFVPESKAARARRFDLPGQVLIVVLFASVIAATIEGPRRGWGDGWIIALVVLTALALAAILLVEPRRREPLIELRFFRSPPFSGANAISLLMTASLAGLLFLSTLYLQDARHFTPMQAGLTIIPLAAAQAIAANVSGRLVATHQDRLALALGGGLITLGSFGLVFLTVDTTIVSVLAAYAAFGFGVGLIGPPVSHTAISGLPADQTGVAGAIAASARQFGSAIGVAVTGSLVATTGAGFIESSHTAWAVLPVAGLAALALALVSTSRWAKNTAARNGEHLAAEHR
ncbi:MFS transporter [Xylanimonas ulmi]|uniref:EmrB/QacA subfamily drug resistance transporter n=1 Tax=Xylanimonas ulmi TaxID=228973 RepID=A0A4Q7M643_9MICO|nr:MFS transporter [Xylanibacterium ulmi]RZS62951.1 EmrB/QacA subfamily drug resistance transporter [Xylanibacterium ulmi]